MQFHCHNSHMEKRVAIIGAGISGLLACKYAVSKGFTPVVFEEQSQVGGLWNHTIEITRLQNVRDFFQFSDFPWPPSVHDLFPTSAQFLQYVHSYADHFQLLPYIHFNSRVLTVDYVGESPEEMSTWRLWGGSGKAFGSKGKWNLKVVHTKDQSVKEYVAEFSVVCIGRFSGLPFIPENFLPGEGPEVFSGKVLHSMDYSAMETAAAAEFVRGKRVAIIGSGKSAVDLAFHCADINGNNIPCTMIQRSVHWMFPDPKPWGVSFGFFCFTRFVELMVHKPGEGFFSSALATFLRPLRWAVSMFVESYLRWKLPLKKYDMIPTESFVEGASSCRIMFLPGNFYDKVEDGSIVLKKSKNFNFCKEGVIIEGQHEPIKADIVIYATGYKGDEKLRNIFASPSFQNHILGSPKSILPLYRQIIHPRIPQLAIIGYSESLSNLNTFEMRCKWLSFFLEGTFDLPSIKEMEDDVERWDKYMKRYGGNGNFRRSCIAGVQIWYNDQLCKDIGCNPRRKKGFLSDLFEPYGVKDYDGMSPHQS